MNTLEGLGSICLTPNAPRGTGKPSHLVCGKSVSRILIDPAVKVRPIRWLTRLQVRLNRGLDEVSGACHRDTPTRDLLKP